MDNAEKNTEKTLKVLSAGGLVVYPTDTVYGLLVDAKNQAAVEKLIAFKERPRGKPISVFVSGFQMMEELVHLEHRHRKQLEQVLPGPYTVVLKSNHVVSALLESETGTLGVRIPRFSLVNTLVERFAGPLTATSANRSGHPSVHSIEALMNQLSQEQKAMIDEVVDIGTLPPNKPSTVIDLTGDDIKVLREGDFIFSSPVTFKSSSPDETAQIAHKVMDKYVHDAKTSVAFVLQGDLGAGKTQFSKGVAHYLGVKDTVVSPTFVIYYEYQIPDSSFKSFIHMDLYNIKEREEFKQLGIESYLNSKNVYCIEWGEKAGEIIESLKNNARVIYIHISHENETTREITVRVVEGLKARS